MERVPIEIEANPDNKNYLKTKRDKLGHLILLNTAELKVNKNKTVKNKLIMKPSDVVYLTKSRLVELENELIVLKTAGRKYIAEKIAEARAHGDLSENAEYDAAKEAQGHHEMKINKLETMLSRVKIISPDDMPTNEIYILSVVKVLDINLKEEITFSLVSPEEADFELDKISVTSPIGKSLLGKKKHDIVEIQVPAGLLKFKILEISKIV